MAGDEVAFGDFRLDLGQRKLSRDGVPLRLSGRTLDVLCVLAAERGRTVSKDELINRVWPGGAIGDNNLHVHISALRKALDTDDDGGFLVTVPRRGYRLVGVGQSNEGAFGARPALAPPDRPSIAVLPFQNMSGDAEQDYFADGIVEDIITALSRVRWLFVIARNSSFVFKGRAVDVRQVGAELGVRYVLEGSVRKVAERVRITCQLIDATNGSHVWADRFDGTLDDIFELQDQVTARVVGTMGPRLEQAEINRAKRKPTQSLDAYDYYLRALTSAHQKRERMTEALRLLTRASELDPAFAAPHGLAAFCYVGRKTNGWVTDQAREIEVAAMSARQAAELGNDDAVALSFAAYALVYVVRDLENAGDLADRALSLNPNLAFAWLASAFVRIYREGEQDVAIEHLARAMRLSPVDPYISTFQYATGFAHFIAGRYEDATIWTERALRHGLQDPATLRLAAASHALADRQDQASKLLERAIELDPELRLSNLKERIGPQPSADYARYSDGLRRAGLPE